MKKIALIILAVSAVSCHRSTTEEARVLNVEDTPAEIKIPMALWQDVADGDESVGEAKSGEEEGGILFMSVDVILENKNEGVLKSSPLRIRLPRGGGTIDLADYVGGKSGSFFVRFEWPDVENTKSVRAWFVSRARKRRLGDEIWGAGCHKYFRISSALHALNNGEGLKVNTTRDRHLTVLGGHFVFSVRKSGQTFATQVTFTDSRRPDFFCGDE